MTGVHDPHTGPDSQLLHDGCGECEDRSREPGGGVARLDRVSFERAWRRAADLNRGGLPEDVSRAELPLLDTLWAVQVKLEDACGLPIGQLPYQVRWDE